MKGSWKSWLLVKLIIVVVVLVWFEKWWMVVVVVRGRVCVVCWLISRCVCVGSSVGSGR